MKTNGSVALQDYTEYHYVYIYRYIDIYICLCERNKPSSRSQLAELKLLFY